jgi:peptidoglycan/LPS O-acetylase OafA/YrhL
MTSFGDLSHSRKNHFDLLRLLFALGVMYSHAFVLSGRNTEPIMRLTHNQATPSNLALFGFFVISGYLITASWQRSRSWTEFARRRACRILPGFVLAVLFSFLIAGPLGADSISRYFRDPSSWRFLTLLLMRGPEGVLSTLRSNPLPCNLNGSLWTIRIEIACYVLTAAAGALYVLRGRIVITVLTLALALWEAFSRVPLPFFLWGVLAMGVPYAMGTTAYVWRDHIPVSRWWVVLCLVALVVAAATTGFQYMTWLAGTYLILIAGLSPGEPTMLRRIGDLSYGVYLYAFPIQQLTVYWLHHPGPWTVLAVATPITLLLAFVSWHLVEQPWLRRRPRVSSINADLSTEHAPVPLEAVAT